MKLLPSFLFLLLTFSAKAADPISQGTDDSSLLRGLVVVATPVSAESLADLAKAAPVVVTAVVADADSADALNAALDEADVYGQVTALPVLASGRVPLADDTAALVIGGMDGVADAELQRITRPFGKLILKDGKTWLKPRPDGAADWTHYNGDPQNSQHSQDLLVGPPRGMHWLSGPTNKLAFLLVGRHVIIGTDRPRSGAVNDQSTIARDAFSGLPLWTLPGNIPNTRWSVVFDGDRLFYHGKDRQMLDNQTSILDARTGELLTTLTEGLDFTVTDAEAKEDRNAYRYQLSRAEEMQFRLSGGVLVQVIREEIVALDANSRKRLWSRKAGPSPTGEVPKDAAHVYGFSSPTVGNETLYLIEGEYVRHSSYTLWPMSRPSRMLALDLKTGKEQWILNWEEKDFRSPHAVYNLQFEDDGGDGLLAAAVTGYIPDANKDSTRPRGFGLIVNAKSGEVQYYGREEGAWPGTTGHGHSHLRMHLRGGKAWTLAIGGPIAAWNISNPGEFIDIDKHWRDKGVGMRPVSCTVWRSSPNFWIGGLGLYPLGTEGPVHFNRSGRSDCDIGAFPANGLLYSPPNTCQCQPYLPGTKAYHSRELRDPIPKEERLVKGAAKPAPAPTAAGAADSEWPQWGQGPARRSWLQQQVPTDLKQIWQAKAHSASPPTLIGEQWQRDAVAPNPVTSSCVAEGVLVYAEPHSHHVVALGHDDGKQKWRVRLDGRVDLSPTIYRGLVLAGTRNGYVYALDRDSGELVWRFTAAPVEDRIIVNGQAESPWPVFGAITVDDRGVLAIAGRHTSNDGGLWWWQLDPDTGTITGSGRIHDGPGSEIAANWVDKLEIDQRPIQNSIPVLGDNTLQLVGQPLRRTDKGIGNPDKDQRAGADSFIEWDEFENSQFEERVIRSGRNAIIGERQQTVGGWKKPHYANTLARLFAVDPDGDDFISVGGGLYTASGRGGGGDSKVHRLRSRTKQPFVKERSYMRKADEIWENDDPLLRSRGEPSINAMAASDNAVFLGLSINGPESDKIYRDGRAEMPHRLRVLDAKTGELLCDYPLPAQTVQGGVALANGRVYVTTEDGSITAFGAN